MKYRKIIKKVARRTIQLYSGGYSDFDDLVQIGYMTAFKLLQQKKCYKYILKSIKRAIRGAAINSLYPVSASKKKKILALKIKKLELNGVSCDRIKDYLKINTTLQLDLLMRMYRTVERDIENVLQETDIMG